MIDFYTKSWRGFKIFRLRKMICGKRIKEVRRLLKMKQKDMAEILEISRSYLCSIESGTRGANGRLIIKFLNEFNVRAVWLYNEGGPVFNDFDTCLYIRSSDIHEDEKRYNVSIPKDCIKKDLKSLGEKLLCFTVNNNSMSPTIRAGDIVLIDSSQDLGRAEGLYLLKINGKKMIRRLLFDPEKHLKADNDTMKNSFILVDSTVEFIGKVIRYSRKI